jgi:hypothetical protein
MKKNYYNYYCWALKLKKGGGRKAIRGHVKTKKCRKTAKCSIFWVTTEHLSCKLFYLFLLNEYYTQSTADCKIKMAMQMTIHRERGFSRYVS